MRNYVIAGLLATGLTIGAGVTVLRSSDPQPIVAPGIQRLLQAQETLPAEEIAVLQALRLFSAVEIAFFTKNGRFGTPIELKEDGFLDPEWPRIPNGAYSIACEIGEGDSGYYCYADPAPPHTTFYSINPDQRVQYEIGTRPDDSSPVFGSSQENQ